MSTESRHECTNCGASANTEPVNYRYAESGLPNFMLQGVTIAACPKCGDTEVSIPRMGKIHRTIARALTNSPARLTGAELRFLRKHLGLSGTEFARYLHTDKTKTSKWETEVDKIGPATDRLIRLLVTALDKDMSSQVSAVAEHLPQIRDESGSGWELHVDVQTLQTSFVPVSQAA